MIKQLIQNNTISEIQKITDNNRNRITRIKTSRLCSVNQFNFSDSTYVSIVPIAETSPRWCVEGLQYIFERDSFFIEQDRLKRSIAEEVRIDMTGLAGAPDLWALCYRY